jgi:hypothetical protein
MTRDWKLPRATGGTFGARVIGIAAAEFSPPLYFTEGEPARRLIDQGWTAVKSRLKELEGEFRAAMQSRAVEVEWRCGEDFPTRFIVWQARVCDIVVVGEAAVAGWPTRLCRLSRHGVRASQQLPEQCGDAATQSERIASNVSARVVIAGAYGPLQAEQVDPRG